MWTYFKGNVLIIMVEFYEIEFGHAYNYDFGNTNLWNLCNRFFFIVFYFNKVSI